MIGIIFATRQEAAPFLELASAVAIDDDILPVYRLPTASHPVCRIVLSGMGKVAATLAAVHLVLKYRASALINAGLSGRLSMEKQWRIGDLLRVDSAVEGDCDHFGSPAPPLGCDPGWFADLDAARLVSCDRPVFSSAQRLELAAFADLADMEGAAVVRAAHGYGVPCAMLKGISDGADETGRQDIVRHMDAVSRNIAKVLIRELEKHGVDRSSQGRHD